MEHLSCVWSFTPHRFLIRLQQKAFGQEDVAVAIYRPALPRDAVTLPSDNNFRRKLRLLNSKRIYFPT